MSGERREIVQTSRCGGRVIQVQLIWCVKEVAVAWALSDQVVGEPVHEDGLRRRDRHGEVHPQLVPGSSHQTPLGRRLGQQLQAQSSDLRRRGEHYI